MTHQARTSPGHNKERQRGASTTASLRRVQIWVPDTRSEAFIEECRRQSQAVAAADPAGDDIMRFVAAVYDWAED